MTTATKRRHRRGPARRRFSKHVREGLARLLLDGRTPAAAGRPHNWALKMSTQELDALAAAAEAAGMDRARFMRTACHHLALLVPDVVATIGELERALEAHDFDAASIIGDRLIELGRQLEGGKS